MKNTILPPADMAEYIARQELSFPGNTYLPEKYYSIPEVVRLLNGSGNLFFRTVKKDKDEQTKIFEAITETLRNYLNEVTPAEEVTSGHSVKYPCTYIKQVLNSKKGIEYLRKKAGMVSKKEALAEQTAAAIQNAIDNPMEEYDPAQDPSMVKIIMTEPYKFEYYAIADGGTADYLESVVPEYKQRMINDFILQHLITIDEQRLYSDLAQKFVADDISLEPEGYLSIEMLKDPRNYYEANASMLKLLSLASQLTPDIFKTMEKVVCLQKKTKESKAQAPKKDKQGTDKKSK